ncbi:MAG: hypothetical protein V1870_04440 [Candidatus Aenigmatarchaeota archaeon]
MYLSEILKRAIEERATPSTQYDMRTACRMCTMAFGQYKAALARGDNKADEYRKEISKYMTASGCNASENGDVGGEKCKTHQSSIPRSF